MTHDMQNDDVLTPHIVAACKRVAEDVRQTRYMSRNEMQGDIYTRLRCAIGPAHFDQARFAWSNPAVRAALRLTEHFIAEQEANSPPTDDSVVESLSATLLSAQVVVGVMVAVNTQSARILNEVKTIHATLNPGDSVEST